MLSYTEASQFVKEGLGIGDCVTLLTDDQFQLLRLITRRLHEHSPYHNLFHLSCDPEKRQRPSWEDIKSQMLSGQGGTCYPKNLFTFHLLRGLGFTVGLVFAKMFTTYPPGLKHPAIVVQNVQGASKSYLIDVGVYWPSFEPIDLSFERERPEELQSQFRIKYVKENGEIVRLQRHKLETNGTYIRLCSYCLDMQDPLDVAEYMNRVYSDTEPGASILHEMFCCVQYGQNGKVKLIKEHKFTHYSDDDTFTKVTLKDDNALISCVLENFPQMSESTVVKAVANFRKEGPVIAPDDPFTETLLRF